MNEGMNCRSIGKLATACTLLVAAVSLVACDEKPTGAKQAPGGAASASVALMAPASAEVGTEVTLSVQVTGIEAKLIEIIDQQLGEDLLIASTRPTTDGYEATWTPTIDDEGPYTLRAKALTGAGTVVLSDPHELVVQLPSDGERFVLAARQGGKPTGLTAEATSGKVTLSWDPVKQSTGYYVYRSTTDGFAPTQQNRLGDAAAAGFEDTTAQDGTTYYYRVASYRFNKRNGRTRESLPSDQASAHPGDDQAPTVSITTPSADQSFTSAQPVTIEATASDNVGVVHVELYDGATLVHTASAPPYQYTWAITAADNGTHQWTAKAYDSAGNETVSATRQLTVAIQTAGDTTPPTVSITQPAADATYDSSQTVTIEASVQDDKGVAKVELYDNGVLQATLTSAPFKHGWSVIAADNGVHKWTAKAFDAAGNSAASAPRTLTVQVPVVPATPGGVAAIAGAEQVTISWSTTANATSYNIYWASTTGVTPQTGQKIAGVTSPHVHGGLIDGVTYHYVVTAVNAMGESNPSAEVSATPGGQAPEPDAGTPQPDAGSDPCGNGTCDSDETCQSCPADCFCVSGSVTVTIAADSYVDEADPSANFGSAGKLNTDQSPDQHAYLRFEVSGATAAVQSATLRVFVTNGSTSAPAVYATDGSWSESTISWNNKPAPSGDALAQMGSVGTGWIEIDVTGAVAGNGSYDFVLVPTSTNGTDFESKEGSNPPELVLTFSGDPTPDAGPSPDVSLPPDAGPTPDAAPEPDAPPPLTGSIVNQYAGITTWCRVQTHNHADRFDSVQQDVADYKAAGFDLIFLTSHDDDPQLDPIAGSDPVTARGVEISDPRHGCALGINAAHKQTSYATIQEAIDAVAAAGGLYQINHPNRDDLSPSVVTPLQNLWGMEVGNKGTRWANAEALWDSQISQGRKIWGTFSDDAHGSGVGRGWIEVGTTSDCSLAAVMAGMKKGAMIMSNSLTLTVSVSGNTITAQTDGSSLEWYRENMTKIKTTAASTDSYAVAGDEVFVRVVATNGPDDVAMSQPLFNQ